MLSVDSIDNAYCCGCNDIRFCGCCRLCSGSTAATKQHELLLLPVLLADGGRRMGYEPGRLLDVVVDKHEVELDDAAARPTIIKRKVALLMVLSGRGVALPGQQLLLLPSLVRVLTRWPMLSRFV